MTNAERRPETIAITIGEPAGIGPDIVVALAHIAFDARLVVLGDAELLRARARALNIALKTETFDRDTAGAHRGDGHLTVLPLPVAAPVRAGEIDSANARYVLQLLDRAARGCLAGEWQALVTGPIHKAAVMQAGISFAGHTEYLAQLCGAPTVMLLANDKLKVALATTHLPLKDVPGRITQDGLERVMRIVRRDFVERFKIATPRIGVCGLNPHAGEAGHLGAEEREIIEPLIRKLQRERFDLTGPLSADTAFTDESIKRYDVIVAMFHDQGLPVIKRMGFGETVNITLGLPFVRTSVDHGTALELAASGKASCGSLVAAVRRAIALCRA